MVKNSHAMQDTWVQSLGQKDPLEEEMATHSSILAWEDLWTEEPGKLQSMESQRVGHDWSDWTYCVMGFPGGSAGKESACNAGDLGLIPGLGRSPGEGNSYPLQYSGLENFMDHIAHGVTKSWTWLSKFHFICPLSQWYCPITSSFAVPFSCPQSFLASGSFPKTWEKSKTGSKCIFALHYVESRISLKQ